MRGTWPCRVKAARKRGATVANSPIAGIVISLLRRTLSLPAVPSVTRSACAYCVAALRVTALKSGPRCSLWLVPHGSSVTGLHWHASATR
eukprot:scaffold17860_cov73-Phaeocystis_antarctica.AAC.4